MHLRKLYRSKYRCQTLFLTSAFCASCVCVSYAFLVEEHLKIKIAVKRN